MCHTPSTLKYHSNQSLGRHSLLQWGELEGHFILNDTTSIFFWRSSCGNQPLRERGQRKASECNMRGSNQVRAVIPMGWHIVARSMGRQERMCDHWYNYQ